MCFSVLYINNIFRSGEGEIVILRPDLSYSLKTRHVAAGGKVSTSLFNTSVTAVKEEKRRWQAPYVDVEH